MLRAILVYTAEVVSVGLVVWGVWLCVVKPPPIRLFSSRVRDEPLGWIVLGFVARLFGVRSRAGRAKRQPPRRRRPL